MKTKQNIFFGFAVLIIAAMFVSTLLAMAGCDNGTTSGGSFVAVTDITNLPQIALKDVELELSGAVEPSNATNQTIIWSGDGVANGKFKGLTAQNYTVTATVANGASETSPYTKTFTITVSDAATAEINKAQGVWTKNAPVSTSQGSATLTMTITGCNWTMDADLGGGNKYANYHTGIILKADGTNYKVQVNTKLGSPLYEFETGTYDFQDSDNKLILTCPGDPYAKSAGTWIKPPTTEYLNAKSWVCNSGSMPGDATSITLVFSGTNQWTETMDGGSKNGQTITGTYTLSGLTITCIITAGGTLTGPEVAPGTIYSATFDATLATTFTAPNGLVFSRQP